MPTWRLAQARGERLRAGPHDWVARQVLTSAVSRAARYAETELGLETGMRCARQGGGRPPTGRSSLEQVAVLAQADACMRPYARLLADWFEAQAPRAGTNCCRPGVPMARTLAATQRWVDLGEAAALELLATQAERMPA